MIQAAALFQAARDARVVIATAESCTGGMVAVAITDIAGSSAIFDRGFVTYTNDAKIDMLGVKQPTLDVFGAVSEQVANEMASGAVSNSNATIAVSITGIAGPGGSDHKPEGRVCFGLCYQSKTETQTVEFGALGRSRVRDAARDHALSMLLEAINASRK
ncbi:MAG: nicotinamide-nucleotide amidase [Yoonia sp.]